MLTIKKIAITIILSITLINLSAQLDSSLMQQNTAYEIIVGKCDRDDLQKGDFSKYFFEEYINYQLDSELLYNIKNKIFNCSITIVLGTWCHDSQQQVPRFIKILDKLDYNTNYLEIICVDKEKKAGDINLSTMDIERVPTFIFYKDGKELGRIIETPAKSMEIDTYNILSK